MLERILDAETTKKTAGPLVTWAPLQIEDFGTFWLAWTVRGIRELRFPGNDTPRGRTIAESPAEFSVVLRRYLAGEDVDPAVLPIDLEGTDFQLKVWHALREIPKGHVRTYGGVASAVGSPRGMRAVGMANSRNPVPVVVPCHRVVQSGNQLGGFSGGLDLKRRLLELEGVRVVGDHVMPGQLKLI